jgi:hypothetical protein
MDESLGVIVAPAHLVDHSVSSVRWRASHYTGDKSYHEFKEGDQVMIARVSPHIPTTKLIIGHFGKIVEVDDMSNSSVDVQCYTCDGIHTMHEDELDFMGDAHMNALRDKTNTMRAFEREPVDERVQITEHIENTIALGMHAAGFLMPAVEDLPIPASDPEFRRPHWSKYVYGKIWRIAPFSAYHAPLVDIARSVDGVLVEWASKSMQHGWVTIGADDLETLTLEMPIRACIQSRASVEDNLYDQAKWAAVQWLKNKFEIDMAAVYHAVKKQGWKLSNWSAPTTILDKHCFTIEDSRVQSAATAHADFMEWAEKNWIWDGHYEVRVFATRDSVTEILGVVIRLEKGKLEIEPEDDAPF